MRRRLGYLVLAVASASSAAIAFACGSDDEGNTSSTSSSSSSSSSGSGGAGSHDAGDGGGEGDARAEDGACIIEKVADPNAGTSGGPGGCNRESDCTVRFTGSFCCPSQPQAMTHGVAMAFDESLNGFGQECREACKTVRCGPPPDASATCAGGRCVLH